MSAVSKIGFIFAFVAVLLFASCGRFTNDDDPNASHDSNTSDDTAVATDEDALTPHTQISTPPLPIWVNTRPAAETPDLLPDEQVTSLHVSILRAAGASLVRTAESASAWTVQVSGCVSGYAPTFDEGNANLPLYRGDHSCLAELKLFTLDGIVWEMDPVGHATFCSGLGTKCSFKNPAQDQTITVETTSELTSGGLTTNENADWLVTEVSNDGNHTVDTQVDYDPNTGYSINNDPNFHLNSVTLIGLDSNTNTGTFRFKLNCDASIVNTGGRDTWTCDGDVISTFLVKLIDDTYSGSLTEADANTLMSANTTAINDANSNIKDIDETLYGGGGNLANGGISVDLDGPANIYGNREMLLLISNGTDHRYFTITAINDL